MAGVRASLSVRGNRVIKIHMQADAAVATSPDKVRIETLSSRSVREIE